MANTIFEILTSIEIIVLAILLIIIVSIINPNIKFLKKNSKNKMDEPKKEFIPKIEEPEKIIVPNSTYEILMKEKKKRK